MSELTDRIAKLRADLPNPNPVLSDGQQSLAEIERMFDEFPDVSVRRELLPMPIYFRQAAPRAHGQDY